MTTDRWNDDPYASSPRPRGRGTLPRRAGPPGGPPLLTPARLVLGVATLGSVLFILYGLVARDATQIPMLCAGFGVFGIVMIVLATWGAIVTYREARTGHSGRALAFALGGGIAALVAAGSISAAIVLALVWGG